MQETTRKNLQLIIDTFKDEFPENYSMEYFDHQSPGVQKDIFSKIWSSLGNKTIPDIENSIINKFDIPQIKKLSFSTTLWNKMKDTVAVKSHEKMKEMKTMEPKPKWNDLPIKTRNNFEYWLGSHTKDYDPKFSVKLFTMLPDEIKVDFLYVLANRFGIDNYYDFKTFYRSSEDMKKGIPSSLKITTAIQQAIYDIIPIGSDSILKTIKSSDKETWSAETNVAFVMGMDQESIDAEREKRKFDSKLAKLKARTNSMTTLEQYQIVLSDPLFDRNMFDIIMKRLSKQTAFKDSYYDSSSKDILSLIVNHPLATTDDLLKINNMKTIYKTYSGSAGLIYNSAILNSAIANKSDAPLSDILKMVKLQQYDIKVKALKRKDLSEADKNIIIDYAIKQHSHMPEQLKEIFDAGNINIDKYKKEIINTVSKKYGLVENEEPSRSVKSSTMFTFLTTMKGYGWEDSVSDALKDYITKVLYRDFLGGMITQDRIIKFFTKVDNSTSEYLLNFYELTSDDSFLPETARDIFLF